MKGKKIEMSEFDQKMIETLNEYVTESRLRNVISKHGEVTQKQFGTILNMFIADVMEDHEKDNASEDDINFNVTPLDVCTDEHQVRRQFSSMCSNFIGMHFGTIVSGNF